MNELYVIIDHNSHNAIMYMVFLLTELCLTNWKDSFNNHFLFFLQMLFVSAHYEFVSTSIFKSSTNIQSW